MVWLLLKFVVLFSFTVDEVLRLRKMNGFSRYLVAQLEEETRTTVNVVYGRKMMRIHCTGKPAFTLELAIGRERTHSAFS